MRALVAFYSRIVFRLGALSVALGLGALAFALLLRTVGSPDLALTGVVAAVVFVNFLLLGVIVHRTGEGVLDWLPVSPGRAAAARLIVLGAAWTLAAIALGTLPAVGSGVARTVNLCLIGIAGFSLMDTVARRTRGAASLRRIILSSGAAGVCAGVVIAGVRETAMGSWTATPWLGVVTGLLVFAAFAVPLSTEVARRDGGGGAARRRTRSPARSLLRIAWLDPMRIGFAVLLLLMSVGYPFARNGKLLYAFLLLGWAPMLFQGTLYAYRSVLPLPIPRARAFRAFVLPAWGAYAFFVAVYAAGTVVATGRVGEALAESLVLLAIAGVILYLQVVASRPLAIVLGLFLVIAVAPVLILPALGVAPAQEMLDAVKAAWLGALAFGGGIGTALVAAAGAGIAGATLLGMWRAFPRLQWTDLPAASSTR